MAFEHILGVGVGGRRRDRPGGVAACSFKSHFEDDARRSHVLVTVYRGCAFLFIHLFRVFVPVLFVCLCLVVVVCMQGHVSLCTLICVLQTSSYIKD